MSKLYNLARMTTATTGTGTITLGSAASVNGVLYLTFAQAGISDGETVSYAIADANNSEIGTGVYTAAGTTLTRNVTASTNANSAISLSGSAQVFIAPRKEDIANLGEVNSFTDATASTSSTTGSMKLAGGLGVAKAVYSGAEVSALAASGFCLDTHSVLNLNNPYVRLLTIDGAQFFISGPTGDPTNYYDRTTHKWRTAGQVLIATLNATSLTFVASTAATSTTTGVIVVPGGIGLGGSIVYGGLIATGAAAPTIASANTIAPTAPINFISGTTLLKTITPPSPISSGGGQITLIPTGLWSTDATGNIAIASTAVVSKALIMTYDTTTTKWYPSY